ncbi:MAG: hypothetical protein WAU57_09710 [Xanthobacteraceae bacterium]
MSSERRSDAERDRADAALLNFEVDDAAIEIAATGAGTIPTASVNLVPPNCCTDRPVRLSR